MKPLRSTLPFLLAAVLSAAGVTAAFADCEAKTTAFEAAARSKSPAELLRAYDEIRNDTDCDFNIDRYRSRTVAVMIDSLSDPAQASQRKTAEQFAVENLQIAGNWRLAEHLGDYYAASRQQRDAMSWYEAGLGFLNAHPAQTITAAELHQLQIKAQAAKKVASADNEGHTPGVFARSVRGIDGKLGGIYSPPPLRAVEAEPVALPINFVFDSVNFTPVGLNAAEELAAALSESNVPEIHLIGHSDSRGDRRYNIVLSQRRAEAVKAFLLDRLSKKGVAIAISTEGVGAEQPFEVSALAYQPSQDEIWELERRVDFVRVNK